MDEVVQKGQKMATRLVTADKLLALLGVNEPNATKVVITIEPDALVTVEVTKAIECNEGLEEYKEMFTLISLEDK